MMPSLRELVLCSLSHLKEQGITRLSIDDEARQTLRSWMQLARGITPKQAPCASTQPNTSSAPSQAPAAGEGINLRELCGLESPLAQGAETEPEEIFFRPGGTTLEEKWTNFHHLLPAWLPLRELKSLRDQMIPGSGNRAASIMMVADAPHYKDEQAGSPLAGEAGTKLNEMLRAMGLSREDIYLSYLVKFRPAMPRQSTNNRPPNDKEIHISSAVLSTEIELVKPQAIVALGVIAARGILGQGALPLAEYQAKPQFYKGIPVIVTHHPSYLLRTSDRKERRKLWEDMLRVMEIAQLPISEKQRGYFSAQA